MQQAVEEIPELGIVLADGCRLSGRLWRPVGAGPVPCILEFIPYRKGDGTAARDAAMHPWFAAHGYACLRVDLRGSGESDGVLDDEYSAQELSDACEVIGWAAAQGWCSGRVGMMGKSWGGFNCLQTAALRPAALGAVVTVCSTTDRFADDIHFKGGCLLGENFGWGSLMLAYNARPPDPAVREDWRIEWLRRLNDNPHLSARWASHQARDGYWQHGSVCEDWSAIRAPVLSWGGWHDGYMNTVAHLVENLEVPVQGIVGPWVHQYAHQAVPGPAIGFLQCALRWWDRWLKNVPNGAENDGKMRVYRLKSGPPDACAAHLAGDWISLPDWPLTGRRRLHLSDRGLGAAGPLLATIATPQTLGFAAGEYFPMGLDAEMARDQARDDALSVCFETPPLDAPLSMIGQARLRLRLQSDEPLAFVVARLCAVMPDGRSTRLAHGFLNLCHRGSRENPEPVPVGHEFEVEITLDQMAVEVQPGQKLRLALSNSLWPFVWPSPRAARLTLHHGILDLPDTPGPFARWSPPEPVSAPPLAVERLTPSHAARRIEEDLLARTQALVVEDDSGWQRMPWGLETRAAMVERFEIAPNDPNSAKSRIDWNIGYRRAGWETAVHVAAEMTCDAEQFQFNARVRASENGSLVSDRVFKESVPRRWV